MLFVPFFCLSTLQSTQFIRLLYSAVHQPSQSLQFTKKPSQNFWDLWPFLSFLFFMVFLSFFGPTRDDVAPTRAHERKAGEGNSIQNRNIWLVKEVRISRSSLFDEMRLYKFSAASSFKIPVEHATLLNKLNLELVHVWRNFLEQGPKQKRKTRKTRQR